MHRLIFGLKSIKMNQPRYIAIDRRQENDENENKNNYRYCIVLGITFNSYFYDIHEFIYIWHSTLTTENKVSSEVSGAQQEPNQAPPTEELEPGSVAQSEELSTKDQTLRLNQLLN